MIEARLPLPLIQLVELEIVVEPLLDRVPGGAFRCRDQTFGLVDLSLDVVRLLD